MPNLIYITHKSVHSWRFRITGRFPCKAIHWYYLNTQTYIFNTPRMCLQGTYKRWGWGVRGKIRQVHVNKGPQTFAFRPSTVCDDPLRVLSVIFTNDEGFHTGIVTNFNNSSAPISGHVLLVMLISTRSPTSNKYGGISLNESSGPLCDVPIAIRQSKWFLHDEITKDPLCGPHGHLT